jgi:hypothetical protein
VTLSVRASAARSASVKNGALRHAATMAGVPAVLLDGQPGLVLAPKGRLRRVMRFVFEGDRIAAIEIIGDPVRLRTFERSLLDADESPTPG